MDSQADGPACSVSRARGESSGRKWGTGHGGEKRGRVAGLLSARGLNAEAALLSAEFVELPDSNALIVAIERSSYLVGLLVAERVRCVLMIPEALRASLRT
eukprot:9095112-Pyramimonas_sp.AAC.1